jgi:peptide deformylase
MELVTGKNLFSGHAKSVVKYSDIENDAKALIDFLDEHNGKFMGRHSTAYALHHAQVRTQDDYSPFNFFVVSPNIVEGQDSAFFLDGRIIVNPEILEMTDKVEMDVPSRKVEMVNNKLEVKLTTEKKELKNKIQVPEGCMSFPFRTAKNVDRYYKVKVRYFIPKKTLFGGWKLKKIEDWITGLKAHIFQHECDHALGKNIFHA